MIIRRIPCLSRFFAGWQLKNNKNKHMKWSIKMIGLFIQTNDDHFYAEFHVAIKKQ